MHAPRSHWLDALAQLLITAVVLSGLALLLASPAILRSGCTWRLAPGAPRVVVHDPATCPECLRWREPHDAPAPIVDPRDPPPGPIEGMKWQRFGSTQSHAGK